MGSINSVLPRKLGSQHKALGAKENTQNTPPDPRAIMAEKAPVESEMPSGAGSGPGPGLGAANSMNRLRRPRSILSKEYIDMLSPSAPSPITNKDDKPPLAVPYQRRGFHLQHLSSPRSRVSRQTSSPSSPGLAANRVVQPAANGLLGFARDPSPIDPLRQHNLAGFEDEINVNEHFDDFDALDIKDAELARIMEDEFHAQMVTRHHDNHEAFPSNQQVINQSPTMANDKDAAIDKVLTVFPDICIKHVLNLYDSLSQDPDGIVFHILEDMDSGKPYPKAKDTKNTLKRKMEQRDEDEEAARKYEAAEKCANIGLAIQRTMRTILSLEFPDIPMTFIDHCMRQNGNRLFLTYRVLDEAERTYSAENPPYIKNRTKRKMLGEYREADVAAYISTHSHNQERVDVLKELQVARKVRKNAEAKREQERQLQLAEEANLVKARVEGTMQDCECCFVESPMNRMIHCDSEKDLHWFCKECAKRNAETVIGQSKYQLVCMAMEGCTSSFSMAQRSLFLCDKTIIALERNEQESNLRMAGIENLASCPFCPYAAEYPPVEIDKEFRCDAPECEKVSCRLCKLESHIPKSCEENAKETGLSIRRQVEEAMSEALIRKCNKCSTPFVKEDGCNKMTCTRSGCHNVQCYVCSKSCSYSHFNDAARGGKAGNCPLFEQTAQRHEDDVKKAEKDALERIRTEHPSYTEEDLKIKVSEAVLQDEQRRRTNGTVPRGVAQPVFVDPYELLRARLPALPDMANNPMQNVLGEVHNQLQEHHARGAAPNDPVMDNMFRIAPNAIDNRPPAIRNPRLGPPGVPDMPFRHVHPLVAPGAPDLGHMFGARNMAGPAMYQPPAPHQGDQVGNFIMNRKNEELNDALQRVEARFMDFINQDGGAGGNAKYAAQQANPQAKPQAEKGQLNVGRQPNRFAEPVAAIHPPDNVNELQRESNLYRNFERVHRAQREQRIKELDELMDPKYQRGQ